MNPSDIKNGKGVHFAIVPQDSFELALTDEAKEIFTAHQFELTVPIEYNALRSVVIRHIDQVIQEYSDEDIVESINQSNSWAEAESIYRIVTTGRMIKVKFKNTLMVKRALEEGIVVVHQKIPAKNIEREIFVKLTPCYNCFDYTHKTSACQIPKQTVCAYCGANDHLQYNCKSNNPKCLNCGEKHRTLASVCPVRKNLIKQRGKEMRERSRSRSRARQQTQQTYATMTTGQQQRQTTPILSMNSEETKNLVTKIITSVAYSHYMEVFQPGTFQVNMNKMFDLNNIPRVNFPSDIITENVKDIYSDTLSQMQQTQDTQANMETDQTRQEHTDNTNRQAQAMESETAKRARESLSPTIDQDPKKKKDEQDIETENVQLRQPVPERQTQTVSENLRRPTAPPPAPPDSGGSGSEVMGATGGGPSGEGTRQRPLQKRERSLTRPGAFQLRTREIGIIVYIKRSSRLNIETPTIQSREAIRQAILKGELKFQWRHTGVAYESIHHGFVKKTINMEEIKYERVPDKDYDQIKYKCIGQTNK